MASKSAETPKVKFLVLDPQVQLDAARNALSNAEDAYYRRWLSTPPEQQDALDDAVAEIERLQAEVKRVEAEAK